MEKLITKPDWMKVAEVELVYKSKVKASERPAIRVSTDAYKLLLASWNPDTIELVEHFKVLFLNQSNHVLGIQHLSSGGITSTTVDPRLIFSAALKSCAAGLVVSHNHPSGALNPSRSDIELTDKLKQASAFLDIKLLDHLIITPEKYYSFADNGLL